MVPIRPLPGMLAPNATQSQRLGASKIARQDPTFSSLPFEERNRRYEDIISKNPSISVPTAPAPQIRMPTTLLPAQQQAQQFMPTTPSGWDAQTYTNFKRANPKLEPDAEDTARMQSAGAPNGGTGGFNDALQSILRKKFGIQQSAGAATRGLLNLPEELAATPGFAGLRLKQAQSLQNIEESGLNNLLQSSLGAADISRRRIEDINKMELEEKKALAPGKINEFASKQLGYFADETGKPIIDANGKPMPLPKGGVDQKELFSMVSDITGKIRLDPDIRDFVQIRDGFERVKAGANQQSGIGDMAVIFGYMKILDPSSTVREGEYANAENAPGIASQVRNFYNKIIDGDKLEQPARDAYVKIAHDLYKTKEGSYKKAFNFYTNQAEHFGIPKDLILRDFGTTVPEDPARNIFMPSSGNKSLPRTVPQAQGGYASPQQPAPGVPPADIQNPFLYPENSWVAPELLKDSAFMEELRKEGLIK